MRGRIGVSCLLICVSVLAVHAQPLEPLDRDVENIVFGSWVEASGRIDRVLYEADFAAALRRCAYSMFTMSDQRIEAMFPNREFARGDLAIFRFEDGLLLAQAGAATPNPRKVSAAQVRTEHSLMLRVASNAFWDHANHSWIDLAFANPLWGDIVVGEAMGETRAYKMLLVMRHNGDSGLYVKCEG
jgi:hypothetical protein